ncbi:YcxB family protein [Antarctobacter sp.]|uniref:YcxB family protein n=1 Tax=Antarctobacter sp. TaxID=1872577 RepID=UPI002B266710|nr:YcxB family protein [Antarctobacter sp.]
MADLSFTGTVSGLNHARICGRLRKRHQPWLMRWGVLACLGIYIVLMFLLVLVANLTALRLPDWSSYLPLLVLFAALVWLSLWRRRHVWDSVRDAPVRRAPQQFDLTPEGLHIRGDLIDSLIRWPAVLDVIEDPEGLLLLTGQMEYIAIPIEAFADPDAMRAAKAACEDWIKAARAPI